MNVLLNGLNVEISGLSDSKSDSDELFTNLIVPSLLGNILGLVGFPFFTSWRSLLSATSFSKDLLKFSLNMPCCEILFITMLALIDKSTCCVTLSLVHCDPDHWWLSMSRVKTAQLSGEWSVVCLLSPGSDDPWSVPEMTLDWAELSPSLQSLTQRADPELWKCYSYQVENCQLLEITRWWLRVLWPASFLEILDNSEIQMHAVQCGQLTHRQDRRSVVMLRWRIFINDDSKGDSRNYTIYRDCILLYF